MSIKGPEFYYFRQLTNHGIEYSRGAAACIYFNVSLILLPVCRNLVTFVRYIMPKGPAKKIFDANIKSHKMVPNIIY